MDVNPDTQLHVRGLNHMTVPVRDRYSAARFYVAVLGAEVHHESAPDRVKKGLSRSLQVGVRLCPGLEVDLFEQDYGQPDWNQSHPHHALDVSAESLEQWTRHLERWRVPFVGRMTRAGTVGAEIYFNDPDGNHLELHCSDYPDHDKLPAGPYDKKDTVHNESWPPAEVEEEANRLLNASLDRMRERKTKG